MTREEAIRCFWYFSNVAGSEKNVIALTRRDKEVFDMAIEALSAESCEDTISRRAVIDTLDNTDKFMDEDRTVETYKALLKECYEVLPSVTPKATECEDTISRADTIEWLKKVTVTDGITFETGFKQILTDIRNMPSVTPKQKMCFDGMTNGEVIKALFPNGKVIKCDEAIGYEQMLDDKYSYCSWFDGLWWDAPYRAESEGTA